MSSDGDDGFGFELRLGMRVTCFGMTSRIVTRRRQILSDSYKKRKASSHRIGMAGGGL